jgi:hypothetical protein
MKYRILVVEDNPLNREGCATWKRHLAGFLFLWHVSERLSTYRKYAVQKGDPYA